MLSEIPEDITKESTNPLKEFVHVPEQDATSGCESLLLQNRIQEKFYETIHSVLWSSKNAAPNKWFEESSIDETDIFHGCDERLSIEPATKMQNSPQYAWFGGVQSSST